MIENRSDRTVNFRISVLLLIFGCVCVGAYAAEVEDSVTSGKHLELLRIGGTYANDVFSAWSQAGAYGQANYHSFSQLNLWRIDENGEITGDGCFFKKWDISGDNKVLTLYFDPLGKLMWHDGEPVTMEDVLFTFEHYKKQNSAKFQTITNVEPVSDTSIRLTFSEPTAFGFMHGTTLTAYLLPKHIWENIEDPRTYRGPDAVIGCGPFKFVSVDQDAQISYYEAVEDYPIGEITIDRVELKSYDNQAAILMALRNDEVDVMYCYSASLDTSLLPTIENNRDIDKGESIDKGTVQLIFGFDQQPTEDLNFRKGIAYALNYELISQTISGGYGEIASTGAASPAQLGYADGFPKNRQDIKKANEYLDEGGFKDIDGDGMRELPDGSQMEVKVLVYYYPPDLVPKYKRIVEIMQVNLEEVGVRISADEQSMADNRDYILDVIRNNKYQLWIGSTTISTATWGGIANYVADLPDISGQFFGTYKDPEYLDAYTRMLCSTNYDEYKQAYKDAQRMNAEQTTAIVLDISKVFYPYRTDKITGWINYPGMGAVHGATWYNTYAK